ncbi:MAG: pyridoxal phosphate-dependent aminotransferase [Rickettsiales bacterium]
MRMISEKLIQINPSPTLMAETKARELRAKGLPVISLSTGEPDFDTPDYIKLAAIDAIKNGYTKYTPIGGITELKLAIIEKFKRENNLEYDVNQVCIGSGAKQVIYNALMASLNPGDEVLILAPYWVSYPEMVKIAGGTPVIVEADLKHNFSLEIDKIESRISKKTKWLLLNSPNNPSGKIYSYQELKKLADMLLKHEHVYILTDDIYEHLVYDTAKFHTLASVEPKLKNRILTVNGVSKTYAMTGWRIGYCAGPIELIKAMTIIQSQSTSNPCSISQWAAVTALNGPQDFIPQNNKIFLRRRNEAAAIFNAIPNLECIAPEGAFYLFVNCSGLFGKKTPNNAILKDSNDVTNYLLEQALVAVVSGEAFGVNGFFRISYATNDHDLLEACNRIKKACELLF